MQKQQYDKMASEISEAIVSVWNDDLSNCEDGIKIDDLWLILDRYLKDTPMMTAINSDKNYEMVNCEGLATLLAEDAWNEEVKAKGLTEDDLYETVDGKRLVKSEWAQVFFNLRDAYLNLIAQHKYKQSCSLQGEQK